jgi:VIT family protein
VIGADLSTKALLILGAANLFADGFSMAAANFTGTKAEIEEYESGWRSGLPATIWASTLMTGLPFFSIGSLRSRWSPAPWWRAGLETFAIGITRRRWLISSA